MAQAATAVRHDGCDQSPFQYSDHYHPNYEVSFFHQGKVIAPQPSSSTDDPLQSIRVPLHDIAFQTATKAQQLSQAMVQQALELGQMFWQMQSNLKRKEYRAFLSIVGWGSTKVRKYINLAKTFDGFERSPKGAALRYRSWSRWS